MQQSEVVKSFGELNRLLPVGRRRAIANNHEKAANQIRMERLLSFIYNYQRTHGGATPPITVMAHEMETTDQQASRYLNMLNDAGQVYIIDRAPLRVMITNPADVVPLVDARRIDNAIKPSKLDHSAPQNQARERFEMAEARRHQLARYIGGYEAINGDRGPSLREMTTHMGTNSHGHVNEMLNILQSRGLVRRTDHGPRLTEAGKITFGFTHPKAQTTAPKQEEEVTMGAKGPQLNERRRKLFEYAKSYIGQNGVSPTYKEMREVLGTTFDSPVAQALKAYEKLGLIRRQHGRFTLVEQAQPKVEPEKSSRVVIPKAGPGRGKGPRGVQFTNMKKLALAIADSVETYGRPPEASEMAPMIGYTNSGVRNLLHVMRDQGWVSFPDKKTRQLSLTERGKDIIRHERQEVRTPPREEAPPPVAVPISPLAMPSPDLLETLDRAGRTQTAGELMPEPAPPRGGSGARGAKTVSVKDFDDADLVLELIERGFVVRRG